MGCKVAIEGAISQGGNGEPSGHGQCREYHTTKDIAALMRHTVDVNNFDP